jgi:hypothetical protein
VAKNAKAIKIRDTELTRLLLTKLGPIKPSARRAAEVLGASKDTIIRILAEGKIRPTAKSVTVEEMFRKVGPSLLPFIPANLRSAIVDGTQQPDFKGRKSLSRKTSRKSNNGRTESNPDALRHIGIGDSQRPGTGGPSTLTVEDEGMTERQLADALQDVGRLYREVQRLNEELAAKAETISCLNAQIVTLKARGKRKLRANGTQGSSEGDQKPDA